MSLPEKYGILLLTVVFAKVVWLPHKKKGRDLLQFVLDGIVLLVIIFITLSGIRKGLIKAAADFLGAIASAVLASWLGGMLATFLYDTFFREGLYDRVLAVAEGKTGAEAVDSMFASMPDFVVRLLQINGITKTSVSLNMGDAAKDIAQAVTSALSPVFISIIKIFALIILFILFMMIIKALASLLSGLFKLPVLAQINGLLGGVFGFLFAGVLIWVVFSLIAFLSPILDPSWQKSVESTVNSSVVTKFIMSANPFSWLFG